VDAVPGCGGEEFHGRVRRAPQCRLDVERYDRGWNDETCTSWGKRELGGIIVPSTQPGLMLYDTVCGGSHSKIQNVPAGTRGEGLTQPDMLEYR
jgi:hypothetical protein